MTFLGGLYLAAFGDKNVCGGWAGMWAEHDCMTFVGFDDGGRAQFCFCFFLQTVYLTWLFWMHVHDFASTRGHSQCIITPEFISGCKIHGQRGFSW